MEETGSSASGPAPKQWEPPAETLQPSPDNPPPEPPQGPPDKPPAEPPPPARGLGVLELMYGALFTPTATFRQVVARPPLGRAALIVAFVAILGAIVGTISAERELAAGLEGAGGLIPPLSLGPITVFFGLVGPFVWWYSQTAILHLTASLLGGSGGVVPLMAALALASTPEVFTAPVMLLGMWVHSSLGTWLSMALGLWSLVLYVLGVREAYRFSTGRAVATVLLPVLALLVFLGIGIVVFVVSFAPLFRQFMPGPLPLP